MRQPILAPNGKTRPCEQMREGLIDSTMGAIGQMNKTLDELEKTRGQLKQQKDTLNLSPACRTKLDRLVEQIDKFLNRIIQDRSQLIDNARDLNRVSCDSLLDSNGQPSGLAKDYGGNAATSSSNDALMNEAMAYKLDQLLAECGVLTDATPKPEWRKKKNARINRLPNT